MAVMHVFYIKTQNLYHHFTWLARSSVVGPVLEQRVDDEHGGKGHTQPQRHHRWETTKRPHDDVEV